VTVSRLTVLAIGWLASSTVAGSSGKVERNLALTEAHSLRSQITHNRAFE
jgi:hypothetical protein